MKCKYCKKKVEDRDVCEECITKTIEEYSKRKYN